MAAPDLQADWDRTQSLFGSDSPAAAQDGERRWEVTELVSNRRNARTQQPPSFTCHLKEAFCSHPVGPLEKGVLHWSPIQHLQEGGCAHSSLPPHPTGTSPCVPVTHRTAQSWRQQSSVSSRSGSSPWSRGRWERGCKWDRRKHLRFTQE